MAYSHVENERLVEMTIIEKDDLRYAELFEGIDTDVDFVQDKHGNWRLGGTGQPASFATPKDETAYKRGMGAAI